VAVQWPQWSLTGGGYFTALDMGTPPQRVRIASEIGLASSLLMLPCTCPRARAPRSRRHQVSRVQLYTGSHTARVLPCTPEPMCLGLGAAGFSLRPCEAQRGCPGQHQQPRSAWRPLGRCEGTLWERLAGEGRGLARSEAGEAEGEDPGCHFEQPLGSRPQCVLASCSRTHCIWNPQTSAP